MQLGLRMHDGEPLPLPQLLPKVYAQGFSCGHIALSKSIQENSVDIAALTPGYAMFLRRLFAQNHIDIAVLGCYLDLSNETADLEKYLAHIRFASILGAGVVGSETPGKNLDILMNNLRTVVSYAEKMGVLFAIEPVATHVVSTPQIARQVLDAIHSPNLGIIFDPVNLLCMENVERREQIITDAITLLGREIMAVHIKDYRIVDGQMQSVAAGTGDMDYTKILTFLKKEKPYIHATLEDTNPQNAEAARTHIQQIYDRIL